MTAGRAALLAAAAGFLVYAGSLGGGFVYDDIPLILENPLVRAGTPAQVLASPYWRRPVAGAGGLYRPLTVATYALNYRLTGFSAPAFRAVNAALHSAVAALVVFLASALGWTPAGALAAGLSFAVLPIHSEAVSWPVGRAELLATLFALSAWLAWMETRPGRLVLGSLLFLCALLSKESAAALPAAVAAADLAQRKDPLRRYPAWVAAIVTLGVYLFWRSQVLGAAFHVGRSYFGALGWPAVPLTMARFFWRGWAIPGATGLGLCADWSRPAFRDSTATDPTGWLALATLAATTAWSARRRAVGPLVFLALAAPMSNLLVPMEVLGAERTMYLPSVGLSLLLASIAERLPRAVKVGVLIVWSALTWSRASIWGSEQTLWEATIRCAPGNPRAETGLAKVRAGQNRRQEARARLKIAVNADPDYGAAAFNLALLDFEDGAPGPADAVLAAFESAHPPGDARFAALRGRIAERLGRLDEAVSQYRRATGLDPLYALPRRNLGLILARAGKLAEARHELEAALALDPTDSELRAFLSSAVFIR